MERKPHKYTRKGEARKARARIIKRIVRDYAEGFIIVLVLVSALIYFGGHLIWALWQGNL